MVWFGLRAGASKSPGEKRFISAFGYKQVCRRMMTSNVSYWDFSKCVGVAIRKAVAESFLVLQGFQRDLVVLIFICSGVPFY